MGKSWSAFEKDDFDHFWSKYGAIARACRLADSEGLELWLQEGEGAERKLPLPMNRVTISVSVFEGFRGSSREGIVAAAAATPPHYLSIPPADVAYFSKRQPRDYHIAKVSRPEIEAAIAEAAALVAGSESPTIGAFCEKVHGSTPPHSPWRVVGVQSVDIAFETYAEFENAFRATVRLAIHDRWALTPVTSA